MVRKKRISQQIYTFLILAHRAAVLSQHHAEAGAVLVHAFRGKKPNHKNRALDLPPLPCDIQTIYKLSLNEFFIRGEGNNAQRVLRSQRPGKVKGERHVYAAHATHREGQDTEAWRHRCSVGEGSKASSAFNSAMKWLLELSCSDHSIPDTDMLATTLIHLSLKRWAASTSPVLHSMQYDLLQGFHAQCLEHVNSSALSNQDPE